MSDRRPSAETRADVHFVNCPVRFSVAARVVLHELFPMGVEDRLVLRGKSAPPGDQQRRLVLIALGREGDALLSRASPVLQLLMEGGGHGL